MNEPPRMGKALTMGVFLEDLGVPEVIDAIQDGWRVIKFPELALWADENRTYEVGGEFVLEKWPLQ